MGNCCSSANDGADKDNFAGPGRVLGSTSGTPANATSSLPAGRTTRAQQGGRTLGGDSDNDAKAAAARAAEGRLNKSQGGSNSAAGAKLQAQLDAQKKQTLNDTLKQSAADNQAARDADAAAQARQWN